MADSDSDSNFQMEPTVFSSEDILDKSVSTPTVSICGTSTDNTIYLADTDFFSEDSLLPAIDTITDETLDTKWSENCSLF